MSTLYISYW